MAEVAAVVVAAVETDLQTIGLFLLNDRNKNLIEKVQKTMANDLRKKMIIMSWVGTIITILFVTSIVNVGYGELTKAGLLLIALSVVNVFYNGLAYTVFWGLCGLGVLLLGYEKKAFALGLLALAVVIMAADMILWIRAIKRDGIRGLLRVKITDRPKIYARVDFYKENEITCILWNKLKKNRIRAPAPLILNPDVVKTGCAMTNDERKRVLKFILTESILVLLLISAMVCLLYKKFVWTGILFITVGGVNTFFLGLPVTNVFILAGLMLVSLGYEKRGLAMIFGAFGLAIITANIILMHKSILSGALERLEILAKSNRFAFFDYLRENEITCILLNKLKRRLNWTETGKNRREGE